MAENLVSIYTGAKGPEESAAESSLRAQGSSGDLYLVLKSRARARQSP